MLQLIKDIFNIIASAVLVIIAIPLTILWWLIKMPFVWLCGRWEGK